LPATIPPLFRGSVIVGDFLFSRYRLMLLAVVAASLLAVWLLLHKTSFGRVVRAALLVGIVRGITIHFVPAAGEASIYVLMFVVLMARPRGLLGERIEK